MKLRWPWEWSLQWRITTLLICLVIVAGSTADVFYSRYTKSILEKRLLEKVDFIMRFYVGSITQSLAAQDDIKLLDDVKHLENDQEIISITVVDDRKEVRYDADAQKMGSVSDDPDILEAFTKGESRL